LSLFINRNSNDPIEGGLKLNVAVFSIASSVQKIEVTEWPNAFIKIILPWLVGSNLSKTSQLLVVG
jgi:hypothetical protein